MSNSRALLISAVLAGVAMLMVYSYVSDKETEIKREFGEEVVVLIAREDIPALSDIYPDMVRAVAIPKRFLQPGYVTAEEREALFVNTKTVASTTILRGEQIVKTKLLFQGVQTGVSGQVSMGKRALSLPVTEITAVNKLLKPGNRVDIVASMTIRIKDGQEIVVHNIVQDVVILATGNLIQHEIPRELTVDPVSLEERIEDLRKRQAYTTVIVEVSPLDASRLIWVLNSGGAMHLALRNNSDRRIVDVKTVRQGDVLVGGSGGL